MCENKILYSIDKWDEKELENLICNNIQLYHNEHDFTTWSEVCEVLIKEYGFQECNKGIRLHDDGHNGPCFMQQKQ